MTIQQQVENDIESVRARKELEALETAARNKIEEIEALLSQYNLKIEEYILTPSITILNELLDLKGLINIKVQELEQTLTN